MTVDLVCIWCKESFQRPYKQRDQKLCGFSCGGKYAQRNRKNSFEKPCEVCGKLFKTIPSRIKAGRGKLCSKVCYGKSMSVFHTGKKMSEETKVKLSLKRRGELNPAYKHGRSSSMANYGSRFNLVLKEKILTRDGFACQKCFATDKTLVVHHLDHNKLNNVFTNLVTICNSCHATYHRNYEFEHKSSKRFATS